MALVEMCDPKSSCSICLEIVEEQGKRSMSKLRCGHQFHLDCIGSAFNIKGKMECPNCRHIEGGNWLYAMGNSTNNDIFNNSDLVFLSDNETTDLLDLRDLLLEVETIDSELTYTTSENFQSGTWLPVDGGSSPPPIYSSTRQENVEFESSIPAFAGYSPPDYYSSRRRGIFHSAPILENNRPQRLPGSRNSSQVQRRNVPATNILNSPPPIYSSTRQENVEFESSIPAFAGYSPPDYYSSRRRGTFHPAPILENNRPQRLPGPRNSSQVQRRNVPATTILNSSQVQRRNVPATTILNSSQVQRRNVPATNILNSPPPIYSSTRQENVEFESSIPAFAGYSPPDYYSSRRRGTFHSAPILENNRPQRLPGPRNSSQVQRRNVPATTILNSSQVHGQNVPPNHTRNSSQFHGRNVRPAHLRNSPIAWVSHSRPVHGQIASPTHLQNPVTAQVRHSHGQNSSRLSDQNSFGVNRQNPPHGQISSSTYVENSAHILNSAEQENFPRGLVPNSAPTDLLDSPSAPLRDSCPPITSLCSMFIDLASLIH